jgi:hypothetical protein
MSHREDPTVSASPDVAEGAEENHRRPKAKPKKIDATTGLVKPAD